MQKKEFLHIKALPYLIILGICLFGILFGSFFDYEISSSIVDTKDIFGGFIETLGFLPSFLMIILAGCLLFKGLVPYKNILLKITAYSLLAASYLTSGYICAHYITEKRSADKLYGIVFSPIWSYIIGFSFCLVFLCLFLYLIKSQDQKYLIVAGSIILLCMISQYIFVELIKKLNCRPRYRYLINADLNTNGEVFRQWWEFTPFAFNDDYHKSFPSGHSANCTVTLLLPLLGNALRHPFKKNQLFLFLLSLGYTSLVAFYRIRYGAHFLSDVSFGILFTVLFILFFLFLGDKIYQKINSSSKQVDSVQ